MRWPHPSSRAARFAARLEGRHIAGSLDDDTAALVALAERLRRVEHPVMRPEYGADLRVRLLEAAPELLGAADDTDLLRAPAGRYPHGTPRIRLGVAAATAIVLGTCTGVGYASQSALPGGPLYPIKRALEHVQLATAGSNLDRGHEQFDQADTRLAEVKDLAAQHLQDPSASILMSSALHDFSDQASDGTSALIVAYEHEGAGYQTIADVRAFTAHSVASLDSLSGLVPSDVVSDVSNAAVLMVSLDADAVATCETCSGQAPLHLPTNLTRGEPGAPGAVAVPPGIVIPTINPFDPQPSTLPTATATSGTGDATATGPSSVGPSASGVPSTDSGQTSTEPTTGPTTQGSTTDVPSSPPPTTAAPQTSDTTLTETIVTTVLETLTTTVPDTLTTSVDPLTTSLPPDSTPLSDSVSPASQTELSPLSSPTLP